MAQQLWVNAYVDGDDLVLIRRDARGERTHRRIPAEWVSYHLIADIKSLECERELRDFDGCRSIRPEGDYLRVSWRGPGTRHEMLTKKELPLAQRPSFEGDVDPIRRYFTDSGDGIAKPIPGYIDLETDSRKSFAEAKAGKARVLCWTLVDGAGRVEADVLEEDTDAAERVLLRAFWAAAERVDQLVAWNGDRFDFLVLVKRSEYLGIEVDIRDWVLLDHMVAFEKMNKQVAESGDEKRSMRLENIAQAVLGRGKRKELGLIPDKEPGAQTWEMWFEGGEWRRKLLAYNVADAILLHDIEDETGYVALLQALCEVCRLIPNTDALHNLKQMDGFLLRLGLERGHHFPTKFWDKRDEDEEKEKAKFKGAYVMQPRRTGLLRDVHIADFKGTYPHVILTWNISPEAMMPDAPMTGPVAPGTCRAPSTGVVFRTDKKGILVEAIEELIRMRKYWNDLKASLPPGSPEWHDADRKSNACKVAANAFYGGMGSSYGRYFDVRIAESITQACVWLIQATIAEAEREKGFEVLYSDTDSVLVQGCSKDEFARFVKRLNADVYPRLTREKGCPVCHIEINYEKAFARMCLVGAKRYIGQFLHYKGKAPEAGAKPEIKGLEYKRGDCTEYAARLQGKVIDLLMGGLNLNPGERVPTEALPPYFALLKEARRHVLEDPLPLSEVCKSQSLGKSLREYEGSKKAKEDGTAGADLLHVGIAKILKARGRDIGKGVRIEYVIADASVSPMRAMPAEDYAGECDRHYVWESLVYPPTYRLLKAAFPDQDWDAWESSRPPASSKGLPGQLTLGQQSALDGDRSPSGMGPMVVPFRRKTQIDEVVRIREGEGGSVARLAEVLRRHRGNRLLAFEIELRSGARVDLGSKLLVSGSQEMRDAVEAWRREHADGAITLL